MQLKVPEVAKLHGENDQREVTSRGSRTEDQMERRHTYGCSLKAINVGPVLSAVAGSHDNCLQVC